jgi:peptidoglycan/LPS O-acetylase OafA/YrhL
MGIDCLSILVEKIFSLINQTMSAVDTHTTPLPAQKVAQEEPITTPTAKKERVFFPNLDGLRFFCFLSVFLYHSFATDYKYIMETSLYKNVKYFIAGNGNLGVNFFFVLSGFLITYLLIVEKEKFKQINIGGFYVRRILRIWPLFYFCVFFGFVIFPILKTMFGQVPNETAHWPYYVTFLNNFDFLKNGLPDSSVLGILWSVAIEEQFYVIWPLAMAFTPSKYYWHLFISIITVSLIYRYMNVHDGGILENHTLSCISDMTVGGLSATMVYYLPSFKNKMIHLNKAAVILLYLAVAAVFFFRKELFWQNDILHAFDRLIIAALFALVILEQNYSERSLFKMSRYKRLSKLGTYTYGLYCLHMIGILIASILLKKTGLNKNVYQVIFLEGGLSLLLTIVLAYVSYTYYESWFLKFKNKFSRITKD